MTRAAITALAIFAVMLAGPSASAAGIDEARGYLTAGLLPDGRLDGATETDVVEALGVIEDGATRHAILLALTSAAPDNNEAALARLVALAQTPYADPVASESVRSALVAGELGLAPASGGRDPLVLAWALRLAAVDPQFAPFAPSLGLTLASLARPDGGFGFVDNPNDLALTAEAARALRVAGPYASAAVSRSVPAGGLTSSTGSSRWPWKA